MGKLFGYLLAFLIIITMCIWTLVVFLGGAEILWWILTGDFFHFVSSNVGVISGF